MEKSNNKGSSAKLKHLLARMLLDSSCTATTTIAEATPHPCTDCRYRNSRPSRATDDHHPQPLFFLMNRKENDKENMELIESVSPSEGKQWTKEASERKKKKKKKKKNKKKKKKTKTKKVLFDAYGFTSSSSSDNGNDHGLFSSDEEKKDEDGSGTLFSSKSFSSESSEFYHSSRKKKKKNTRNKRMKSTRRPPRRHVKHYQEPQLLVSISSSEKETKPEAQAYDAGFPVVKRSTDPYGDFRSSMSEMIVERGMSRARDLERLLHAYLHLNSPRHHLAILEAFADLAVVKSHAALPPQLVYWNSVVPNTPMPSAISNEMLGIMFADVTDEQKSGTNVSVGMRGVSVSSKGETGGATVKVGQGGVHVRTWKPGGGTTDDVGEEGVNANTSLKGNPPVVVRVPFSSGLSFSYAAAETQIHDDPSVALFFLEKGLKPGSKMSLQFKKTTAGAAFLPREEAESIPFSSAKLPEILNYYGVKPGSAEALVMEKTLQECENPAVRGETKFCATSLESMVEFSMSSLGTLNVTAVSTAVSKAGSTLQLYTITEVNPLPGYRLVACHPVAYKYAVFYCHTTSTSKAYRVGLVGADKAVAEAVAVCHTDTKAWNPNHVVFMVLKVKPGSVPVCHFLPENHVVWSRST
ncbi:hypothetical protein B296_00019201 [Ensete ventricosum]|uniref:Transcription repressor n=1 Tax=Ensete ventricosum TaxID=4639 RepID=A0A426ZD06_ENSVE|nr:hypothetical protein B296_00019201 [Ensete ventricosum]